MKIAIWGKEEEIFLKFFGNLNFHKDDVILDAIDQLNHLISTLKTTNEIVSLNEVINFEDVDLYIFVDFPDLSNKFVKKAFNSKKYNFLITFENQLIWPNNFNKKYLSLFYKIFTWNDEIVDNIKFFKYSRTYSTKPLVVDFEERNKLCCMISMNKVINFNQSLFKKRLECIQWFEDNSFQDFDLYGLNWDKYYFSGLKIFKILNRISFITKFLSYKFKCYKGPIAGSLEDKISILKKYKFSVAFENMDNLNGYITEKIFHCFFSLTVPIYLGASNINKYVPRDCFIDMRDFNNFRDLYLYIKNMKHSQYINYINNIKDFLSSEKYKLFTNEYSSNTIVNEVKKLIIK